MASQNDKVLAYMNLYGFITILECIYRLNITRLSARIWDLREAGYQIADKLVERLKGVSND